MADFDAARRAYAAARDTEARARLALMRAREGAKQLERAGKRAPQGAIDTASRKYAAARAATQTAGKEFGDLADPRKSLGQLPDDTPVALFPLRLETRFMTQARRQLLCVRVFPDDILVDQFQPLIGQPELASVRLYWTRRWRAGGDVGAHRAAWAQLARASGSGRAKWLIEQVAPLNPQDEPAVSAGEHVLVILPPAPLPAAERGPIATFWQRVWSTSGAGRDAAFADLQAAVGNARAAQIESQLAPENLRDVAVKPGPSITPVVAYLDLPDPATLPLAQDTWTQGAHTWLLPEKLVLLGFQDGKNVLEVLGEAIPPDLQVGPDPGASDSDQIQSAGGELKLPDALRWMTDFATAVEQGMGFRVDLTERKLEPRFDRLFVLGVRVGSDASAGAAELATLIGNHQASRKGFTLLPQGRPTNNTDGTRAGYTWWEDPDESFHHYFEIDPTDDPTPWSRRRDGAWLAGLLGLPREALRKSVNYFGTDQAEARAMNAALWPATLGYYMEQMMEPVFSEQTVLDTRAFFNRFVIGRGTAPLVRVGRQPYGFLPTTVWSKMNWWAEGGYPRTASLSGLPSSNYLAGLNQLTERGASLWNGLAGSVANVGAPGPDPQQTLLDIVGLHPTSAEFYQRWSQSFTQYYNALGFETAPVSEPVSAAARTYVAAGLAGLQEFGWNIPIEGPLPALLEKIFLEQATLLKGDLVDATLSDTQSLRSTRADGRNYIEWLQWAARTSHDTLRRQEGFSGEVPSALLYLFLRHALDLGYVEADLDLRRVALGLSYAAWRAQRKEPQFIQVADGSAQHSRWQGLYRPEPAVTQNASQRMGDFIPTVLATRSLYLGTQLAALDTLKNATTGALERAFVEHLDCLTYRLDSWRLGLHAVQLSYLRGESDQGFSKGGLLLGAYGWLENVRPKARELEPVELDAELAAIFDDGAAPLLRDSSNFGHIHAPSLDQAVTAAILRNGYLANATPQAPDLMAIDLSSERVRLAQTAIEGIRNGQSLGALLGYRLERSLHDEPTVYLDELIYELRRAFPLAGNRNLLTQQNVDDISLVEARNVVDGMAFAQHVTTTNKTSYPYGLSTLPALTDLTQPGSPGAAEIGVLIDAAVADMRGVADAVADLGVAEGLYQLVRGNYDRSAGALDAFSKGTHPPQPEVVNTPRKGNTLTHRVALQLAGGLDPADAAFKSPRERGEPALAQWLRTQLPDLSTVFARVRWTNTSAGTSGSLTASLADLGLQPADLFYLIDAGGPSDMPGLDDLLIDRAERQAPAQRPRHDAIFELEYKPAGVAGLTVFELAPLVRSLRGFILGSRALRPTDFSLQNDASTTDDAAVIVRTDKVQTVLDALQGTRAAVNAFVTTVGAAVGTGVAPDVARDAARDHIDAWLVAQAAALRPVVPFGLQAGSLTTGVEGRRARLTAMLDAIEVVIERWQKKQGDFDAMMTTYAALPVTATDAQRQALLVSAGRIVSTQVIAPLPPLIADLEDAVAQLRDDLDTGLADLTTLRDDATTVGATLQALTAFLPTMAALDQTPFDIEPFRASVLSLAQDLLQKASFVSADIERRVTAATEALADAANAVGDKAQAAALKGAKALLGEAFMLLPEFKLPAERLAEWHDVWTNRGKLLEHLTTGAEATPFPVDDWLHGVARVRDRLRQFEMATLLGETLGGTPRPLTALQFPYRVDEPWLGLGFPAPFVLEEDKLLYSAAFDTGAEIDTAHPQASYSGLLLDEWVEVVPSKVANTGLSFHFDRPNSEAPQAVLLATPPVLAGAWQWQTLVDTLHETLDFAKLRAVEPTQLDQTVLGPLLPAILSSVTTYPITASLNLALNNDVHLALAGTQA